MGHYFISAEGEYLPVGSSTFAHSNPKHLAFPLNRRCIDKNKGLRHFSLKVCELVKEKGRTSYNEVADELVHEFFYYQDAAMPNPYGYRLGTTTDPVFMQKRAFEMKNIRRRVYDSLNVLIAMNVIEKNKSRKDIRWVGMSALNLQEIKKLTVDKEEREARVREKNATLDELTVQLETYKKVLNRNKKKEIENGETYCSGKIPLPYLLVDSKERAEIDVTNDKAEFFFTFPKPFEIFDDLEVLDRLGLTHKLPGEEETSKDTENKKKEEEKVPKSPINDAVDPMEDLKAEELLEEDMQQQ